MVPLKLSLKNFLCYRDNVPTLHLEGFRVACLCGQNGHGKSALLDAITWALWGKARGKNQDELIYYGAGEMQVELEFEARGDHYRVMRRHARAGAGSRRKGGSDLQLQIHDGAEFVPITGNIIRETQGNIEQLIGMDYDTFINSAFLLQGRADEFTNRTPGERKQVLAKVMGLEEYDRLQEQARERAAEKRREADRVEDGLERMGREVLRREEIQHKLDAVQADLVQVDLQLKVKGNEVEGLNRQVDNLRRQREELQQLQARIAGLGQDLSHMQKDLESRCSRIAQYQAALESRDSIMDRSEKLKGLRSQYEEKVSLQSRHDELRDRRAGLINVIGEQRSRLEEQVRLLETRMADELEPKASSVAEVERSLKLASVRLQEFQQEEMGLEEMGRRLSTHSSEVGGLQARLEALRLEGVELKDKLDLLGRSQEGTTCPLCGTALGPEACQHLADNYDAQIQEKRQTYQEVQVELKSAEEEKARLEKDLSEGQTSYQLKQRKAQEMVTSLERDLREAREAHASFQQARGQLSETQSRLEHRQYAAEEQTHLAEVDSQLRGLDYDQEAQGKLYLDMQQLQPVEEEHRRLLEAETSLPGEEEALVQAERMHQRRQEELEESRGRQAAIDIEVSALPALEQRLMAEGSLLKELDGKHSELLAQRGNLEGELGRIDEMEQQIGEDQKRVASHREEQGVYEALDEAFGRRGVQAMLIETLLPRLEEEANVLLGRMTDHRMNLKLEAQRERRSRQGEPIETLDITISDELGPRSYEMFSGGEAFRINLALRIALSKVLANRRGAPLPTLFIDEGFGTQDTAGRERILDVIRAIEEDFQKIIVITHLEDLKEAFEARIQVEKGEEGATVWLS